MTTRTSSGRKKRRPYRREQILEAAVRLFNERGYSATSMVDIGAAAGMSGAAIYRHFESKDEILETAVQRVVHRVSTRTNEIRSENLSATQTLQRFFEMLAEVYVRNADLVRVNLREHHHLKPGTQIRMKRTERLFVEECVHVLAELRPETDDARLRTMIHAALALCRSAAFYRSGLDIRALAGMLADMSMTALLGTTIEQQTSSERPDVATKRASQGA